MQNANPRTSASATIDIKAGDPSINLRFNCLCSPPPSSISSGPARSASISAIAESAVSISPAAVSESLAISCSLLAFGLFVLSAAFWAFANSKKPKAKSPIKAIFNPFIFI